MPENIHEATTPLAHYTKTSTYNTELDQKNLEDFIDTSRETLSRKFKEYLINDENLTQLAKEARDHIVQKHQQLGLKIDISKLSGVTFLDPKISEDRRANVLGMGRADGKFVPSHGLSFVVIGDDPAVAAYVTAHELTHTVGKIALGVRVDQSGQKELAHTGGYHTVPRTADPEYKSQRGLVLEEAVATWLGVDFLLHGSGEQITKIRNELKNRLNITDKTEFPEMIIEQGLLNVLDDEYVAAYSLAKKLLGYKKSGLDILTFTARVDWSQRTSLLKALETEFKSKQLAKNIFKLPFESQAIYDFIDDVTESRYKN